MKHAVVVPALKKGGSDASVLTNYRPIFNITFVAKITERFVAQQLQHFMEENRIYGIYQSAYRAHQSAETALVRIHNDFAALRQLHWLPVRKRIEYKLLVLVHRALYDGTPEYLAALLLQHAPRRSLRSAGGLLLEVPRVNLERFGRRAFACAGPTLWNKLPRNMRDNDNLVQFKKEFKKKIVFHITSFTQRTLYFSLTIFIYLFIYLFTCMYPPVYIIF